MKKLIIISLTALLAACSSTGKIDLSSRNSYGLKCSPNANSAPNWEGCMGTAEQMCAPQKVANVQQLSPTGSGSPDDSYFMTFSCQ